MERLYKHAETADVDIISSVCWFDLKDRKETSDNNLQNMLRMYKVKLPY